MPKHLGINVDHVATLRNARGGTMPCPVEAARHALAAGADVIVAHLREDRRHIRDADLDQLCRQARLPLELEIALTDEMLAIGLQLVPAGVCFVPERRQELTTESGLDLRSVRSQLVKANGALQRSGIRVSVFIAPDPEQIDIAAALGVTAVELHTGEYANARTAAERQARLALLRRGAQRAAAGGLRVAFGHGLTLDNLSAVSAIPEATAFNIGHAVVAEAVFCGIGGAVRAFRNMIDRHTPDD